MNTPNDTHPENNKVDFIKQTYQLKGISYMSLSLNYIVLLMITSLLTLFFVGTYTINKNYFGLILTALIGGGFGFFIFNTGIKYGAYGLEIMIGKSIQKKHIKNDFPIIRQRLNREEFLFTKSILINPKRKKRIQTLLKKQASYSTNTSNQKVIEI